MAYNKEKHKEYVAKNREKIRQYQKNYQKTNKANRQKYLLKYTYNISLEDYNTLFNKQNGKCAVCLKEETSLDNRGNSIKKLAVDHCHSTGKVRGLLCNRCNTALGLLKEDKEIVNNILNYLKEHK